MWLARYSLERKERLNGNGIVAVAIDKDKGSQIALKWAIDHLLQRGQTVYLIHVKLKSPSDSFQKMSMKSDPEATVKELFLRFRCFCTRKDIQCKAVVLEDVDVAKALIEYAANTTIENMVVGASTKTGFLRFKATDVPGSVVKGAPDFCNVFVISKGKIQSMRSASRSAPVISSVRSQLALQIRAKSDKPDFNVTHSATSSVTSSSQHNKEMQKKMEKMEEEISSLKVKYDMICEKNDALVSQVSMWESRWADMQKTWEQKHRGDDGPSTS